MTVSYHQLQMLLEGAQLWDPDDDAALGLFDSIIQHLEPSQTTENGIEQVTLVHLMRETTASLIFESTSFLSYRTLYLDPDGNTDPPSADPLEIHSAIAKILYLSDANRPIDQVFRELEETDAGLPLSDGTGRIDEYVQFMLARHLMCLRARRLWASSR